MDYERAANRKKFGPDQNLPHPSPYTYTIWNSRPYHTFLKSFVFDIVTRVIFGNTTTVPLLNIFPEFRGSFLKRKNHTLQNNPHFPAKLRRNFFVHFLYNFSRAGQTSTKPPVFYFSRPLIIDQRPTFLDIFMLFTSFNLDKLISR